MFIKKKPLKAIELPELIVAKTPGMTGVARVVAYIVEFIDQEHAPGKHIIDYEQAETTHRWNRGWRG